MQITYTINPNSISSASFVSDLNQAIAILESSLVANITIHLDIGYGVDAQQGTTLTNQNESYASPALVYGLNYSTLRGDLLTSSPGFFNATNLPNATSVNGVSTFNVTAAQARVFGIISSNAGSTVDGYVSIGTGFPAGTPRIDAILHEVGHALGREPYAVTSGGNTYYSSFDLFRFLSSGGGRDFNSTNQPSVSSPVAPAYFSLNGGTTDLADFGVYSDPSDFLNAQGETNLPAPYSNLTPNDPFDEFIEGTGTLTPLDLQMMEALGFAIPSPASPPPGGATALMVLNNTNAGNYEIYDIGNDTPLAAYPLAQLTSLNFVALGSFQSGDTGDMLLYNNSIGAFEAAYISGNSFSSSAIVATVGTNWNFAGLGSFNGGSSLSEVLLRNSTGGTFEIYETAGGGAWSAKAVAAVGNNFQIKGFGNFSGASTTQMLMQDTSGDASNGQFELYTYQPSTSSFSGINVSAVGTNFQVKAFGNFSETSTTQMLMQDTSGDTSNGQFELYTYQPGNASFSGINVGRVGSNLSFVGSADILGNGQDQYVMHQTNGDYWLYSYDASAGAFDGTLVGVIGSNFHVVGFGQFDGSGQDEMLMQDAGGDFEVYRYNASLNTFLGSLLATVGPNWTFDGVAASTPGSTGGASGALTAQLVQAMASMGASSAAGTATSPYTGADTAVQTLLTTPQHA
jgi:hypothetical protein